MAKEDEFKIIEDEQDIAEREFNAVMQDLFGIRNTKIDSRLNDRRQEFFALKKKEYRQNKEDAKVIFNSQTVRDLYELGELNLTDAIDLEFFDSLESRDKVAWMHQQNDKIGEIINTLTNLHLVFNMSMPEVSTNFILAYSMLEKAQTVSISQHEYDKMTKSQRNNLAYKNRQSSIAKASTIMDALEEVSTLFWEWDLPYSMADAVFLRKELSKELMTNVNRMCRYNLIINGDTDLLDYKTVRFLRNGVSHESWAEAKNNDKKMRDLDKKFAEIHYSPKKSSEIKVVGMSKN